MRRLVLMYTSILDQTKTSSENDTEILYHGIFAGFFFPGLEAKIIQLLDNLFNLSDIAFINTLLNCQIVVLLIVPIVVFQAVLFGYLSLKIVQIIVNRNLKELLDNKQITTREYHRMTRKRLMQNIR